MRANPGRYLPLLFAHPWIMRQMERMIWFDLCMAAALISIGCAFSIVPPNYELGNAYVHSFSSHARLGKFWSSMPPLRKFQAVAAGGDEEGFYSDNSGLLPEQKTKPEGGSCVQAGFPWLEPTVARLDIAASNGINIPIPQTRKDYFPYGDSSFVDIRREKQFWVDNTRHISYTVECKTKHQMFLRPPCWGKSLFVDMLDNYLDVKQAVNFNELFGGTDIHDMARQHNNKYYVMRLDLSIDVGGGDPAQIEGRLYERIENGVNRFCRRYGIGRQELGSFNALETLKASVEYVEDTLDGKVFILIDEYDRFANKLMFEFPDAYNRKVAGQTGEPFSSPVRAFFETIKSLPRVRTFTVGISPIALADASGVNFIEDISDDPAVGDLVGFSETDVCSALTTIFGAGVDIQPLVELMRRFYNGYSYNALTASGMTSPLYHTQLCLYFFRKLCLLPEFCKLAFNGQVTLTEMMDQNTRVSENVITLLIRQSEFAGIVGDLKAGHSIPIETVPSFLLRSMLSERSSSPQVLISFMRWHGMVTKKWDGGYAIPNLVVGDAKGLLDDVVAAMAEIQYNVRAMINNPSDQVVWEFHQQAFLNMSTRFDNAFSEGAVVGVLEAVLLRQAQREGFEVYAEIPIGMQRADLIFIDRTTKNILLLEYKRLRPGNGAFKYEPDLCWLDGRTVQLRDATSVSDANKQLLPCAITRSKQSFHQNARTVSDLLDSAQDQVSGYAEAILRARPQYSDFHFAKGVVIHATTEGPTRRKPFTTVVGVWLQQPAARSRTQWLKNWWW